VICSTETTSVRLATSIGFALPTDIRLSQLAPSESTPSEQAPPSTTQTLPHPLQQLFHQNLSFMPLDLSVIELHDEG
jgi:hypothetical protein